MASKKKTPPSVSERVSYHTSIKEWPEGERPREKLLERGSSSLSEAELLAILIRTGQKGVTAVDLAKKLLSEKRTLRDIARMSVAELKPFGIGQARATAIVAAFELMRRVQASDGGEKPVIHSPEEVAQRFVPLLGALDHEEFWVLLLNSSNHIMREIRVTSGTLNSSLVHPRECFTDAIREKAAAVIFIHNHPSGNREPSPEDHAVTKQLIESGKILGIPVHDHVIVAESGFTSFAERGWLG